ncbi:hypothetical protein MsedC_1224 [Metallosphaera sedula]|nr:hypothetical protein MsedA_1224 [Metallosphaera sedula]QCO29147.1 hypothetical protein DFR88_00480 [Metallosphaera prunae]AKV76472.1 hypothetical protein MsedB_1226 [Metallosphaera sedula]AKV78724.1 hypothetical protein MsedC_1224 [Metallosphaera sedula]AKV80969.1 hypothetical protein MsedD_1225 [Metallosphaera sedula]
MKHVKLLDLWSSARKVADEGVRVVDETWSYVKMNAKVFSIQVLMAFPFLSKASMSCPQEMGESQPFKDFNSTFQRRRVNK